jgi:hypothetical protein
MGTRLRFEFEDAVAGPAGAVFAVDFVRGRPSESTLRCGWRVPLVVRVMMASEADFSAAMVVLSLLLLLTGEINFP